MKEVKIEMKKCEDKIATSNSQDIQDEYFDEMKDEI